MRPRRTNATWAFSALLLATAVLCCRIAHADAATASKAPVLLELFTSEGCSSCPPADALLEKLARTQPISGATLIVLSEHVDYWNALGWKDPFSAPQFTQRQADYAEKLDPADGSYTPELVVDGRSGVVGSNWDAVRSALDRAAAAQKPALAISRLRVASNTVTAQINAAAPNASHARLYAAVTEDVVTSHVLRGENAGRTLMHVGVVRTLSAFGSIPSRGGSRAIAVHLPSAVKPSNLRVVVFLQNGKTGAILSLASRPL